MSEGLRNGAEAVCPEKERGTESFHCWRLHPKYGQTLVKTNSKCTEVSKRKRIKKSGQRLPYPAAWEEGQSEGGGGSSQPVSGCFFSSLQISVGGLDSGLSTPHILTGCAISKAWGWVVAWRGNWALWYILRCIRGHEMICRPKEGSHRLCRCWLSQLLPDPGNCHFQFMYNCVCVGARVRTQQMLFCFVWSFSWCQAFPAFHCWSLLWAELIPSFGIHNSSPECVPSQGGLAISHLSSSNNTEMES